MIVINVSIQQNCLKVHRQSKQKAMPGGNHFFSGKRPYTARVIQGPPGIFHEPGNFHGRHAATMHNLISESHPDNMNGITKNHIWRKMLIHKHNRFVCFLCSFMESI